MVVARMHGKEKRKLAAPPARERRLRVAVGLWLVAGACGRESGSSPADEGESGPAAPASPVCELEGTESVQLRYSAQIDPFACDITNPPAQSTDLTPLVLGGVSESGVHVLFDKADTSDVRLLVRASGPEYEPLPQSGYLFEANGELAVHELGAIHPEFSAARVEVPLVPNPAPPPMLRADYAAATLSIQRTSGAWERLRPLADCSGVTSSISPTGDWLELEFFGEVPDLGTWFAVTRLREFGGPKFEEHHFVFYGPPSQVRQREIVSLYTAATGTLETTFVISGEGATATVEFPPGCPRFQDSQQCDGTFAASAEQIPRDLVSRLPQRAEYLGDLSFECAFAAVE